MTTTEFEKGDRVRVRYRIAVDFEGVVEALGVSGLLAVRADDGRLHAVRAINTTIAHEPSA